MCVSVWRVYKCVCECVKRPCVCVCCWGLHLKQGVFFMTENIWIKSHDWAGGMK